MKHVWSDLIKMWADGTKIQYRVKLHDIGQEAWHDTENPNWNHWNYEFRKKPAEKVVRWLWVDPNERKLLMYYATEFEASHTKGLIKAEWSRMEFDK